MRRPASSLSGPRRGFQRKTSHRAAGGVCRPVDGRAHLDHQPRLAGRSVGDIRFQLVHTQPGEAPATAGRGAADQLVFAVVRTGEPAVLSGGDGQGAGAPGLHHARRAGDRAADRGGVRKRTQRAASLCVQPHHQPHRCGAGRAAVSPSAATAAGVLSGTPRGRLGGAGARARAHPRLSHRQRADAGAGCDVFGDLHRGDAAVQRAADADRAGVAALVRGLESGGRARAARAAQRQVRPRCRKPGAAGRNRDRHTDRQGRRARAGDGAALGHPACRLRVSQLSHADAGQRGP